MAFGKPGRPPEDRLARQQEIYLAVAPLILELGANQLSMQEAARAASMSVGGLYHYFPTKRDLLLHGLTWEARDYLCRPGRQRIGALELASLEEYIDAYVDHTSMMFEFMRPSVRAAVDLGVVTLQEQLEAALSDGIWELRESLRGLAPWVPTLQLAELARAILRLGLFALIERDVPMSEVRGQLHALFTGYIGEPLAGAHPHLPVRQAEVV